MRPAASVTRSTDSEARTLPEERTTLSSTCGCTTTPSTIIDPADDPDFGAGSLLLEPHEETRSEQQTAMRRDEMRSVATMVLGFLDCVHDGRVFHNPLTFENKGSENRLKSQRASRARVRPLSKIATSLGDKMHSWGPISATMFQSHLLTKKTRQPTDGLHNVNTSTIRLLVPPHTTSLNSILRVCT